MTNFAKAMSQVVSIDLPRNDLLSEHRTRFQARHALAVRMVGHIESDDMGVKMRVEFAACMLGEPSEEQAPGGFVDDFALDPPA